MFRRLGQFIPVLALTAALALPGATQAFAKDKSVPFKAEFSGTASWDFDPTHPVEFAGKGQATHLGRISNAGESILTAPTADTPPNCYPQTHTETLTGANGDKLVVEMLDVACATSAYTFHGTGHWTVVGGTGKFADVQGSGTADGHADFSTGAFAIRLEGNLSH